MESCCNAKENELRLLPERQKRVLKIVLVINLAMFFIEGTYGFVAHSVSLIADSLDMLGDALVYAFSLYVIGKNLKWKNSASLLKGSLMGVFGLGVITQAIYRFFRPELPIAELMGWVGSLALTANFSCALLLLRHRKDDINMRSTWLCSRNDVIANLGVLAAAGAVAITGSRYPDLIVGIVIAGLVFQSSVQVLKESISGLTQNSPT